MQKILKVIDLISDATGKTARWLAVALVLLITLEVTMRYVFDAPTMWNFETSLMTGGVMVALAWAYVHRHNSHVRVDVLYSRCSPRSKALIDVIGTLLLFFPLIFLFANTSISQAMEAWRTGETSIETYWYPPLAPFRTVVALGFVLLAFQGIANFVHDLSRLIYRSKE
jgi:TRAP-type mannitol/chloroaromatic compound transport system permease small subunit